MKVSKKQILDNIEEEIWKEARKEVTDQIMSNQSSIDYHYNYLVYKRAYEKLRQFIIDGDII